MTFNSSTIHFHGKPQTVLHIQATHLSIFIEVATRSRKIRRIFFESGYEY